MATFKVLVVDDSPTDRRLITDALREAGGFTVQTAVDGEEALNMAHESSPDLILLDIILPKKNGFQVCRTLKTTPATKEIKIILVSSKTQDSDRFWGLKQGADNYLTKPFENEDLLRTIQDVMAAD